MTITIRPATPDDVGVAAEIFLRARHQAAADGSIPPIVGTDDGARQYWMRLFDTDAQIHLGVVDGDPVAVLVLVDGWVSHLYVQPGHTNAGVGTQLLNLAKQECPDGLQLWAFQTNTGARRFYARHGFVEVESTDGADNMEKAPDVRCVWSPG